MSIGSITSTGKQNVESGGGVYLVTMRWTVQVTNTQTLSMRVYAYTGRMINNVNDFVDYIFEKGYIQSQNESYYPCEATLAYSGNLITSIKLVAEKEASIRRLSLDYYASWIPGYNNADQTKLISLVCVKL